MVFSLRISFPVECAVLFHWGGFCVGCRFLCARSNSPSRRETPKNAADAKHRRAWGSWSGETGLTGSTLLEPHASLSEPVCACPLSHWRVRLPRERLDILLILSKHHPSCFRDCPFLSPWNITISGCPQLFASQYICTPLFAGSVSDCPKPSEPISVPYSRMPLFPAL